MSSKSILIIGGGPGGYSAALEAAQRKMTVTLVEHQDIGGTCTNRGCIPSKFLLSHAKKCADAIHLKDNGIQFKLESIEPELLFQKKGAVVSTLRQRMEKAIQTAKVDVIAGQAKLTSAHDVEITTATGTITKHADVIILATGTTPVMPEAFPKHPAILNSTTILDLNHIPSHLVVLGGGYIGCELACAFHGFGSRVTLIEKQARLLGTPEFEAAGTVLQRSFEKRGMTVYTNTELKTVTPIDDQRLKIECSNGETFEANALLLALGRKSDFDALNIVAAGLKLDDHKLKVNAHMQTAVDSIYAIGDLVSPLPLAHVATREGQIAIAHIAGEKQKIDYSQVPRCVYTWPEAASVGLTEEQAREAGHQPRVDRYHLAGSSKAMVEGETEGLWMIVSDAKTHQILGGQIVGHNATELIHLVALSLKAGLKAQDVLETVFGHPSLAEGFQEALVRSMAEKNIQRPGTIMNAVRHPLPAEYKRQIPAGPLFNQVNTVLEDENLNTICVSGKCPNRGECFSRGSLAFMILGDICTRHCGFCAVKAGRPEAADAQEPERLARAAAALNLKHVVITGVARDDMADGGASYYAACIRELRKHIPSAISEVLTSDFNGDHAALDVVLDAHPDIYNHNVETVERLTPKVRSRAQYRRSLEVLAYCKAHRRDAAMKTKSGLMLGLGETKDEITQTLNDLRSAGCDYLTIGQYLQPSANHLTIQSFVPISDFDFWKDEAFRLGFERVASGPLVRSSYFADQLHEAGQ